MAVKMIKNADGTYSFPKVEAKAAGKSVYDPSIAYIALKREVVKKITDMLGFAPTAETDKGKDMQRVSVATQFVHDAVDEKMATYGKKAPAPKTGK